MSSVRIAFCGETFPAAHRLLKERLPQDELVVCADCSSLARLSWADVLIPLMFRIDATLMQAVRPRLIQQWGSGLEGVDLEAARAHAIPVASVPTAGGNAESVAEHLVLLILALLRRLPETQANVRAGVLGAPLGRMLAGRTVCVWGLGATALALVSRLGPFGARLLGITSDPGAPKTATFQLDRCYSTAQRAECLKQTEVLVLCLRLSEATRGAIDVGTLKMLPPGAYLVNAARGALVDYDALFTALASGHLAGVGLDVYWQEPVSIQDPLLALPNVIATPHIAGVTDKSYGEIADFVRSNVERLRGGEPLLNRAV